MKIKRIILIPSIILMFGCFSANASNITIQKDAEKITVEAEIDADATAVVKAVKDGYDLDNYDYIYGLEEETANSNGKVTFEFYMSDTKNNVSADGKYNVIVKQNGGGEQTSEFWYASTATRNQLETDLDAKTLTEIISDTNNETVLKAAGFALDVYKSLNSTTGQADVISKVSAEIPDMANADVKDIAKSFNNNVVVSASNINATADVLKQALISAEAVSADTDETMMAWIVKCVDENSPYSNFVTVEKQIKVAEVLSEIIDARFSQLTGLFDTYKTELGLVGNDTYTKYLASSSKEDINEDIATALDSNKPVNAEGLISIIKSCLPSSGGNGGNGGGTGGGSGGSGGSYVGGSNSSGGSPVIGTTTKPVITPSTSNKTAFNDITDAKWAETAVNAMYEKGIVSGDGDGNFRPNDSVKREEFVKMIIVAAGMHSETANCEFSDLHTSSWAYSYIASAVNNGIVNGVSETNFGLGQTLTRQDMAVICARALAKVKPIAKIREDVVFSDDEEISDYAKDSIHSLYCAEMVNGMGDGSFAPKGIATRAQAAQMIYNLFVK